MVKPKTGVIEAVRDPEPPLGADQVAERADDQRLLFGERETAVDRLAGVEVAQLTFELGTPAGDRLRPRGRLERVGLRVEPPDPEVRTLRIDDEDV